MDIFQGGKLIRCHFSLKWSTIIMSFTYILVKKDILALVNRGLLYDSAEIYLYIRFGKSILKKYLYNAPNTEDLEMALYKV